MSGGVSLVLVALLLVIPVVRGECAERDIIPALTVKQEYNDNIFFSATDPVGAYMTVLSPDLDLIANTETTRLLLNAGLDAFLYLDSRKRQTTALNHSYKGQLNGSPTSRLDLGTVLSYRVSNQPDQTLEQNGVILNATRRSRQSYSVNAAYALTERMKGTASYALSRDDYNNPSLVATTSHTAGFRFDADMGGSFLEPSKTVLDLNGAYYTNRDVATRNITASAGIIRGWSEVFSTTVLLGGRYTVSDYAGTQTSAAVRAESTGWVGQLQASYTGEVSQVDLSLSRDVSVSSGRSGPSETTSLSVDLRYNVMEDLVFRASAGYQWDLLSFMQSSGGSLQQETMRFSTGLTYRYSKDVTVNTNYAYTGLALSQNGLSVARNVVFVGITWRYPLFER